MKIERPISILAGILLLTKAGAAQPVQPSNNPLGDAFDSVGRALHLEKPLSCKPGRNGTIPYQCTPESRAAQREALERFMAFNQLFAPRYGYPTCGSYPVRTIFGRTIWRRSCFGGGTPMD